MRKWSICGAALALAALLLLSGCKFSLNLGEKKTVTVEPPAVPEGFTEYKSEEEGFAIAYPSDWEKQEDFEDASLVLIKPVEEGDEYFTTMNVVTEDGAALPLKAYLAAAEADLKSSYDDYEKISSSEYALNGVKAAELVYSCSIRDEESGDSAQLRLIQVIVIYQNKVYVITAAAEESIFSKTEPVFRDVIHTFYPLENKSDAE